MLHGRAPECAAIDAALDGARRSRGGCLVIRGEPGIGKTALVSYAAERAADMHVLRATGAQSESGLPFAALHQLLRTLLGRLDAIPEPQAAALKAALGLAPSQGADRFLVGLAVLTLLSEITGERPLLCLVDDAQWVDPESMDALSFVARRLDAEGIALLLATTDVTDRGSGTADLPALVVVGLDRVASDALLIERSDVPPAAQVRALLWKATSGNPFALIETSSALTAAQLDGGDPLPDELTLGLALQHTLLARADRLPDATRTLLLVAAAEGTGDLGLVLRAAATLGADAGSLEPAELAGLVQVTEARLAFRDPLMRTAVYQGAPFGRRQAAHRALADSLTADDDADRRTWHRSSAAVAPDDSVADELERSAARARLRGGHAAAAAALERAAELSSQPAETGRRLTAAAADAWLAGRGQRTRVLLERAAPLAAAPNVRADIEHLRGLVESGLGDRRLAYDILLAGSEPLISVDPSKAARMLVEAGRIAWLDADLPRVTEVGRRMDALALTDETPLASAVNLMAGLGRLLQADAATAAPLIRASVSGAEVDDPEQLQIAGAASMFTGDDRTARELLTRATARARALGAVSRLVQTLVPLVALEMWEGNFSLATAHASEGVALARETGQEHLAAHFVAYLAWIAALQGRSDDCAALAADASSLGVAHRVRLPVAIARWALALSDMGMGRWSEAMVRLDAVAQPDGPDSHPMVALLATTDLVEAAYRVDRLDLAQTALARFERFAGPDTSPWAHALVARGRALLSVGEPAAASFDEAIGRHAEVERLFDEARTRLLYGEFLRRARRRADARGHLRMAIDIFERLGAAPWEKRARAELRATGETARKREPSTLTQLTPQQTQIVSLVAEGATNREIASQLFLSARTVDYHLRNVFVKLGIASRAELILLRQGDK